VAGYFGGKYSDELTISDNTTPTIEVYKLSLTEAKASDIIPLGPSQQLTSQRKGEIAFYDANLCLQRWHSCSSCHPFARSDATNWTLRSEINAPKNTKSMVYSWWTSPTQWNGGRRGAGGSDGSIRMAWINELFLQPEMKTAGNMDTFFMKLKPTPSPYLVKGQLSEAAKRGKKIFYDDSRVDCITCHPAPLFTDRHFHTSEIRDPWDANANWDTPSLIEAWRTAPYDHIGSMLTITDMLKSPMSDASRMLSQQEMNDLVEYVLSL
jgi:cytochrome c peroxidase